METLSVKKDILREDFETQIKKKMHELDLK